MSGDGSILCLCTIFLCRDFNLEKKIEALPSLSLEEFQEKKKQQRTKKKKIVQKIISASSNKRYQNNYNADSQNNCKMPQAERENAEDAEKALLVGSQKRKARKQSITRNAAATSDSKQIEIEEPNKCKYKYFSYSSLCLFKSHKDARVYYTMLHGLERRHFTLSVKG